MISLYPQILPFACEQLIKARCLKEGKDLKKLKGVMIGRSLLVGQPIAHMMKTILLSCDITDKDCLDLEMISQADIIVIGARSPRLLKKEMIKEGAIIIDVGINDLPPELGNMAGDADFEDLIEKCGAITPVPKGVGPIVVSSLLRNVVEAWK